MNKFYFDLQMFKGNVSSTTTYKMSDEERALLNQQLEYLKEIQPNMSKLNQRAGDLLWNSWADTQADFNGMNQKAQEQSAMHRTL